MTRTDFDQIVASLHTLSPEQLQRLRGELDKQLATSAANAPEAAAEGSTTAAATTGVPVWEQILETMKAVPDEVFDRIPADSSEQLDHYLYGTPKRPTA